MLALENEQQEFAQMMQEKEQQEMDEMGGTAKSPGSIMSGGRCVSFILFSCAKFVTQVCYKFVTHVDLRVHVAQKVAGRRRHGG